MSISRDGNSLFDRARHVGTLVPGANNSMTIRFVDGSRLGEDLLSRIAKFIEAMTQPRIQVDQPDAPTAGTEDANRPRVVSLMGANVFRTVGGSVGDSDPIGSIEEVGTLFQPAPGVNFSHQELSEIAGLLRRPEMVRS